MIKWMTRNIFLRSPEGAETPSVIHLRPLRFVSCFDILRFYLAANYHGEIQECI